MLLTSIGPVTSYADTSVVNGTTYAYKVRAFDAAGNRSGFSNTQTVTTPDTQNPTPPTNLVATVVTSTRVDLTWTAGSDNVGVTNYEIFRGGSLLTTVGNVTSYSDTTVLAGATYSYQVRAMDAATNRSTLSNTATVTTSDLSPPTQPTNLLATAAAYNRIDLTWTASTDNVAVTNYEIYRGGILLATVGAVTSYSDTAVTPGTGYSYQVKALDIAGNRSAASNTSSATTPQQVVTFIPTADARVEQATPTTNFGTATALRVDAGSTPVESYLLFNAVRAGRHAASRDAAGVGVLRDRRWSRRLHEPHELDRDRDHLGDATDAPRHGHRRQGGDHVRHVGRVRRHQPDDRQRHLELRARGLVLGRGRLPFEGSHERPAARDHDGSRGHPGPDRADPVRGSVEPDAGRSLVDHGDRRRRGHRL